MNFLERQPSGYKKRSYHIPDSAGVKQGSIENIQGEWRAYQMDMMRLCSHRFTNVLARNKASKERGQNISGAPWKAEDDLGPLVDEWAPNDHRFFAVILLEKFATLRDLARPEEWGPGFKFLRLYLDHTFRRASELSRQRRTLTGFFPRGAEEPTHIVFHSGLLTRNIEKLYACFHMNTAISTHPHPHSIPRWFLYGFQTEMQLISPAKMKVFHGTTEFNSSMLPDRGAICPLTLAVSSADSRSLFSLFSLISC